MDQEIKQYIDEQIKLHTHDGVLSQRVNFFDLFLNIEAFNAQSATIATTGNTDVYVMAPYNGNIVQVDFSGVDALAASNTNYITWTITNLGQDGSGSTALLSTADSNTTKSTGGTALVANSKRTLVLTTTVASLLVKQGDRLRIRASATGTLANTVTFPVYMIQLQLS